MFLNSQNLQDLFRGYKTSFEKSLNSQPQGLWSQIALEVKSTGKGENYGWIGEAQSLREWIGPRQAKELSLHDYQVDNKPYEGTIKVKKTDIEDDIIGVYDMQATQMGVAAALWPDEVVFALLQLGESRLCYDGQYFFDTDHPTDTTDTATSNLKNNGGANAAHPYYLFDTTKIMKPLIWQLRKAPVFVSKTALTDDHVFMNQEYLFGVDCRGAAGFGLWQCAVKEEGALDATNIEADIVAGTQLKNSEGHLLGINYNVLMVPPIHQFTAKRLVERVYNDSGYAPNVLNGLKVIVNPLLP